MNHIEIKGNYEGYLWKSDEMHPRVLDPLKPVDITLTDGENPFIVEGELWDERNSESISIRFVDGRYRKKVFTVSQTDKNGSELTTQKSYIANRMPGISKLKYLQYWMAEQDELCEGMEVLRPADLVFIGFEKEK